ncbi:hypothetical protein RKLH11_1680 [Rhodobacteraceae bacterium KLH11]|nr:hypothetical protein RKLH11_1680 [Rhodobacteraceae bacterium KLH11]
MIKGGLFIADILVNATGSMMILLFLFIVRLSPWPAPEDPRSTIQPVMIVEIQSSTGATTFPISASLAVQNGKSITVTDDGSTGPNVALSPSFGPEIGNWGGEIEIDFMRLIVPCPPPTSTWDLNLFFPSPKSELRGEISIDISVFAFAESKESIEFNGTKINQFTVKDLALNEDVEQRLQWKFLEETGCEP